ncbi:MAG TPA: phosphoribosyltransferase [Rhabdochlamydiaceae bacterium]|jgi:predicted phosphoribosyltransferase
MLFKDRKDAGRQLVPHLLKYKGQTDVIVLGLARGGVVTASEVADALHLPLNVVLVRKIGAPGNEELAIGAIAEEGEGIFNEHLIGLLGVSNDYLKKEIERQKRVLKERLNLYRGKATPLELKNKTVILVDDGIATGASMRVAIAFIRHCKARRIVLAVPVAAPDSLKTISKEVDETICLSAPAFFEAVGSFYRVFDQTLDEEVMQLLKQGKQE